MARPAQMIKKYTAGVDINAADILWVLLCALLSSCGTGSFAPLGPAAICAGMLTGMGSRAFLGAVIGSAAAYRWAGLAHPLPHMGRTHEKKAQGQAGAAHICRRAYSAHILYRFT